MTFGAVVVGGGVVGTAAALALARRRERVLLLERFAPGHPHGSSHGDGRIIRFTYGEAIYVEMARRAFGAWAELERAAGETLVETTGSWECGPSLSPRLAELEAILGRCGIPFERWTAAESNRRVPHFRLPAGSAAIYQRDGGVVRADRAVRALRRLAADAGVEIRDGERAAAIEVLADRVRVRSAAGVTWEAGVLVLTAGGWAPELLAQVGLEVPLRITREQVAYFPARAVSPVDHRVGAMPTMIDYHDREQPFYALPQIDVPGVKVGWHHGGAELTAAQLEPERRPALDEANFAAVRAFVERRFPHLDPRPVERLGCLYTNTPDYHFVLDRHPRWPHVVVGTGFSGHGFKFAPVLGEILAALARGETPPVDLETFALARFAGGPIRRRIVA